MMDIVIFIGVLFVALIVQLMVEAIKAPIAAVFKYRGTKDRLCALLAPFLSILFAVGLCVLSNADLFVAFGYPLSAPYIGAIVTGTIASLGANKVYDLMTSFQDYKTKISTDKK